MKRKLKPLHQVLSEHDYQLLTDGSDIIISINNYQIGIAELYWFGEEAKHLGYPESFYEPLPEKKKLYAYEAASGEILSYTCELDGRSMKNLGLKRVSDWDRYQDEN